MSDATGEAAERPAAPCPICGRPSDPAARPFCSKRCANIDLHRWLTGRYAVPSDGAVDDDEAPDAPVD